MASCHTMIFVHLPKCAGMSIRQMAQKHLASPHNAISHWRSLYFWMAALQPEAYGSSLPKYGTTAGVPSNIVWTKMRQVHCEKSRGAGSAYGAISDTNCTGLPEWRTSNLFVEFHTSVGFEAFHRHVLPNLAAIRAAHQRRGCRLTTATVLREPRSHVLSYFDYFCVQASSSATRPIRIAGIRENTTTQAAALETWVRAGAVDPQLVALAGCKTSDSDGCIRPFATQCNEPRASERARATLASMDVVGTVDDLEGFWREVVIRLGLTARPNVTLRHVNARSNHSLRLANLPSRVRGQLDVLCNSSRQLFAEARRSGKSRMAARMIAA